MQDYLAAMFPVPSPLELPADQRNSFLYLTPLLQQAEGEERQRLRAQAWGAMEGVLLPLLAVLCCALLVREKLVTWLGGRLGER